MAFDPSTHSYPPLTDPPSLARRSGVRGPKVQTRLLGLSVHTHGTTAPEPPSPLEQDRPGRSDRFDQSARFRSIKAQN